MFYSNLGWTSLTIQSRRRKQHDEQAQEQEQDLRETHSQDAVKLGCDERQAWLVSRLARRETVLQTVAPLWPHLSKGLVDDTDPGHTARVGGEEP